MFRRSGFVISMILIVALAFVGFIAYKRFVPTTVVMVPSPSRETNTTVAVKLPVFSHIFIIILENKSASELVNKDKVPYLNQLARQYASTDNFYATTKPSLPNYLALTGGDTFGVMRDCTDCFIARDNIVTQLETAGRSWKAYMEGMPKPCFVGDAGPLYRQKHNPFIYSGKTMAYCLSPMTKAMAKQAVAPMP
ncbi:MAG: hypothetical protein NT075_35360 [Chloroflexi bacterium]|nr:hypothetical protein [Chloroflexota bacterium]